MAAGAILDFLNFQVLLAYKIWRVKLHHYAKFHQNWSIHSEDIIFRLFKMAATAILNFRNSQILLDDGFWEAKMHHLPNVVKIGQTFVIYHVFYFEDGGRRHHGFQKFSNFIN